MTGGQNGVRSGEQEMTEEIPVARRRRWPGVILSVLVPGFGLVRAGMPYRGVAWFVAVCVSALLAVVSAASSVVPIWLVICVWLVAITVPIWSLWDSFRPGKMTLRCWLLFAGIFAVLAFAPSPPHLVARAFKMPTGSMQPTLLGGRDNRTADHVFADRLSYRFGSPKRGDLMVFGTSQIPMLAMSHPSGEEVYFVKRLVGMPGERIRIADGKVYADGRLLGEKDGIPPIAYSSDLVHPSWANQEGADFIVGPNEYFVLGDNPPHSNDSRYWGCVPASAVYGKITMIYYPFERMRRIGSR